MKKKLILEGSFKIVLFVLALQVQNLTAATNPMQSTIESHKVEPLKETAPPPSVGPALPPIPKPVMGPLTPTYFHPGLMIRREGEWEGNDNLLNISSDIGVNVQIIKPENENIKVNEAQIKSKVEAIFGKGKINPSTIADVKGPPLPFYQIKLFIYPIDRGYAVFCEGRLFESVTLQRFKFDPSMAFQAVTWQRETLLVTPTDRLGDDIMKQVEDITTQFVEIYKYFLDRKKESYR